MRITRSHPIRQPFCKTSSHFWRSLKARFSLLFTPPFPQGERKAL
ncbi:hypothetical protein [Roseofilum sp. Guam]|nr:hypothetical protein [Roseofilum sp. Guam]